MPNVGGRHSIVFPPVPIAAPDPATAPTVDLTQLNAYFEALGDAENYLRILRQLSKSNNRQGDLLIAKAALRRSGENLNVLIAEEQPQR